MESPRFRDPVKTGAAANAYRLCCPYWVQRAQPPGHARPNSVQRRHCRQRLSARPSV